MVRLLGYCLKWKWKHLDFIFALLDYSVIEPPEYVVGFEAWLDSQLFETLDETCSVSDISANNSIQTSPKKQNISFSPEDNHSSPKTVICSSYYNRDLQQSCQGSFPKHTKYSKCWAFWTFPSWINEQNKTLPTNPMPRDLLFNNIPEVVSKCLE